MNSLYRILAAACILTCALVAQAENYIRVNQLGYLPDDIKVAVLLSSESAESPKSFILRNMDSGKATTIKSISNTGALAPFVGSSRLDFSKINEPGRYRIEAAGTISPEFRIGADVYAGANELPLYYMRQQRCGYNPFLGDSCHRHDGVIVLHPTRSGEHIDVTGGWHDASDYLQYTTTSANAIYQMLFAYTQNPDIWADDYDAAGVQGANGIPDILDEARWGLEWLVKMNPDSVTFFNQIADDRDHRMSGLPADDKVDYGFGAGGPRPVYPCSGKPEGLVKHKNRSTGLASTLGKYASSFNLGAAVFKNIDPAFAALLKAKAANAYNIGKANPGACQTAPCVSPYFYEEDNWSDDMELAAMEMYKATGASDYLADAINYGRLEPVTPWFGADSARHYQWYPFVNLGHYLIASEAKDKAVNEFVRNMRSGLARVADRATGNPFLHGIPFVWCSNNLTVGFVTQAMLYRDLTEDESYKEIETAMRDWLFGCNPWGKCMIIGLPENGDFPTDPHSPLSNLKQYPITGGLVDGPVYSSIFNSLWGVHLRNVDRYAPFQGGTAVYHDDYSDYSTNEPTMDGTASLTYMLGKLASKSSEKK